MSQAPTTTSQQGNFNMSGMASALPQQMPYMSQPPQSMGQPQPGYPQQQHGAPIQPQPVMMPGTAVTTQQQPIMMQGPAAPPQQQAPQPDAPSESLIVFD